jgi:hypothetical protein
MGKVSFRNIFIALLFLIFSIQNVFAEQASIKFEITLPEYLKIETVTSAVLTANIVDKTGNLYMPLSTRFKVISNTNETKTLYLKSTSITKNGVEESMFNVGNQVYVAFTNITDIPNSEALINCKIGSHPKLSPGVVAYPITSIIGAEHKYQYGKGKYEIYVNNGETNVTVNLGSHVLRNSFDKNDPYGFYQATLALTEADI